MSDEELNKIWRKLTADEIQELKELCERMIYYCEHPHFDGFEITIADLYASLERLNWMMRGKGDRPQQE